MPSLRLPQLQNYSCHNCGDCCRRYTVFVTDEERDRIRKQNWTPDRGAPAGEAAFAKHAGRWHLAKRDDGFCVFYDADKRRCRIHAAYGEAAKPLACRIFPFTFAPAGNAIAVGVKFSCVSVAANAGATIESQTRDIEPLVRAAASDFTRLAPPRLSQTQQLDWPDTLRLIDAIDNAIRDGQQDHDGTPVPIAMQIIRARFIVSMIGKATFDKIRGKRINELVDTLAHAAPAEVPATLADVPPPRRIALLQLRSLVMHFARLDTLGRNETRLSARLGMVLAGMRFASGTGKTPRMQPQLPRVPFKNLLPPHHPPEAEMAALFNRYLRTQVRSLSFGGAAMHNLPLTVGFDYLTMMVPITCYLARWRARAEGRDRVTIEDLRDGLVMTDRHFGGSPLMGQAHFQGRMRLLASQNEIDPLIVWAAR